MLDALLSTPAVQVSTVSWNRLTNPARHTLVSMAHMKALPNGTSSRPSCVVMSLKPAATTPHTAAMMRNGSTWSLTQSDTKNEAPDPGVHDARAGVERPAVAVGTPLTTVFVMWACLKNVRAMLAADEPMNTPRKIHPILPSRCPSMPAEPLPICQTMRAARTMRLIAAATMSTPWAMLRYLLTFVSHASYMGSTEFWRVETVPDEATSVLRLVLSQSIVSPDCCSYIVHMVFSSQLSLRCLSHDLVDETYVQVPEPSDASSSEICELVALSASHCAEGFATK